MEAMLKMKKLSIEGLKRAYKRGMIAGLHRSTPRIQTWHHRMFFSMRSARLEHDAQPLRCSRRATAYGRRTRLSSNDFQR